MKTAVEKVASDASLQDAWQSIKKGKKGRPSFNRPDHTGESLYSFGANLEGRLSSIQRRLLDGKYYFERLEPVFVPKPNGKERLICIPTIQDRVVQRAILNFLKPRNGWMNNGISYGFVPDLTVGEALEESVSLRNQRPWVFKTDIKAFFDHIPRTQLEERLKVRVKATTILPLLKAAMGCEILCDPHSSLAVKLKKSDIQIGRGVRQGMPLSPYFANVVMEPFDKRCREAGLSAIRYADDLIFFVESNEEAMKAKDFCLHELGKLGLGIPDLGGDSKTKIYTPSEPAEFLGLEIAQASKGYEIRVSSGQMERIKQKILCYGNVKEMIAKGYDITRFGNALESTVRAYESVYEDCANFSDLKSHMANCRRAALESIFGQLGVDLGKLSSAQRQFLCLTEGAA